MMQTCPKCGFLQPKDRYCANCGLDIDSFVPQPESFLQKLQKNTVLHLIIVVVLIFLGAAYVYDREKNKIMTHLQNAPGMLRVNEIAGTTAPTEGQPMETSVEEPPPQTLQTASVVGAADSPPPTTTMKVAQDLNREREIIVTFAEMPIGLISEITTEGKILKESGERRYVAHKDLDWEKLSLRYRDLNSLGHNVTAALKASPTLDFDFTHISGVDNEDVGLKLSIDTDATVERSMELNFTGEVHLKDEASQTISAAGINTKLILESGQSLMVVGLLPRQAIKLEDVNLFSNTPLAIYNSPAFLEGLTDFVIILHIK